MRISNKKFILLFVCFLTIFSRNNISSGVTNETKVDDELFKQLNINIFIEKYIDNPLKFKKDIYSFYSKYSSLDIEVQSSNLVLLNGTTENLENSSQRLGFPNTAIIIFNVKNPVSDNFSLSTFVGLASIDPFGNWNFNSTSPNPFVKITPGSYLYLMTFSIQGLDDREIFVSNSTFIEVPGDNSNDDLDKELFTIRPIQGTNLRLNFIPSTNFGLSGINHISNDIDNNYTIADTDDLASELTIMSYNIENDKKTNLILVQKIFFASWAGDQGISDIILYLPKDKLINVKFVFHSREIGWVSQEIGPINTTIGISEKLHTAILPIFIGQKLINETRSYVSEIEKEGLNIDNYLKTLKSAEDDMVNAISYWEKSNPSFSNRGEILWDQNGVQAIYFSELSLAQISRARNIIDIAYSELTNQPIDEFLLSFFLLISFTIYLVIQIMIHSSKKNYFLQLLFVVIFLISLFYIYPRSEDYFISQGLNVFDIIFIPYFILYIFLYFVLLLLIFGVNKIIKEKQILYSFKTYLDISIRNLRQRKFRTLMTVTTLMLVTTSFVLIISVSFKGDIVSDGYDFESNYNGIGIFNVQEIKLDFFSFKMESRVPIQAETLINVTLDLNSYNDLNVTFRDHIVDLDTFSQDQIEVIIFKTNVLNIPIPSENKSLGNYWAVTPAAEKSISGMDDHLVEGTWLNDTFNLNELSASEVVIPEALALEMGLELNDILFFQFQMSGIETNALLSVVGIINDDFHRVLNVDGNFLNINNYVWENSSNGRFSMQNKGHIESNQVIILNFNWWRIARADSINRASSNIVNVAKTAPAEIIIEPLSDLTSNLYLGEELANRLNPIQVYLAYDNKWFNFEWQIIRIVEGIIPQVIPLLLSIFIISQIVVNSIWERQDEFKLYTILGIRSHNLLGMIVLEFIILGVIAGGFGYFLSLISFPIIKDFLPIFGLDIGDFLTQKFNVTYIFLALGISVFTCIFGSIPLIYIFYKKFSPKKIISNEKTSNLLVYPRLLKSKTHFDKLISFLEIEKIDWTSDIFNSDNNVIIKRIIMDVGQKYLIYYPSKMQKKIMLLNFLETEIFT